MRTRPLRIRPSREVAAFAPSIRRRTLISGSIHLFESARPQFAVVAGVLTPLSHLQFLQHRVDQLQLASDAKDIWHIDLAGARACRVNSEVGGSEAEQPVSE